MTIRHQLSKFVTRSQIRGLLTRSWSVAALRDEIDRQDRDNETAIIQRPLDVYILRDSEALPEK